MPTLVRVENENGDEVESFEDLGDVVTSLAGRAGEGVLVLAQSIDPWGNTVFNRLQMPSLLKDLDALREGASSEEQAALMEVEKLARRAMERIHHYLKFYGD